MCRMTDKMIQTIEFMENIILVPIHAFFKKSNSSWDPRNETVKPFSNKQK